MNREDAKDAKFKKVKLGSISNSSPDTVGALAVNVLRVLAA